MPYGYTYFESEEEGYFDDGVEFYVMDKNIKIDFQMYIKCLELAYEIYVKENGENEDIKDNLITIKKRYKKINVNYYGYTLGHPLPKN